MRHLLTAVPILLSLALPACAPTAGPSLHAQEMRRLSEDCGSRGGILSPTGQHTGRPQTDHFCRITGGASRLRHGG